MAEIGIMGGTFNPIHFAHLLIAENACEQFGLDKVLFITGGNPPHKKEQKITDAAIRAEMTAAAIKNNKRFEPCNYEVEKDGYSYTSDTLEHLKSSMPENNYYLIIGEDSLAYIEKWHEPEKIVQLAELLVYRRGSSRLESEIERIKSLLPAKIRVINSPLIDISSTDIRERVSHGRTIKYMVPDKVIEIIEKKGLYL